MFTDCFKSLENESHSHFFAKPVRSGRITVPIVTAQMPSMSSWSLREYWRLEQTPVHALVASEEETMSFIWYAAIPIIVGPIRRITVFV